MSPALVRGKFSESSVRRLSSYHRVLDDLARQDTEVISSNQLAVLAGTNPAQIRKDLSYFGTFGKRGSGYPVRDLRESIRAILGLNRSWRTVLAGAGNLGHALFSYKEFARYGFEIVGVFDVDPEKVGKIWDGVTISPLSSCAEVITEKQVELALVVTPAAAAQAVVDELCRAGIRGILNFAPRKVEAPPEVVLRNVNITVELEGLTFALQRGIC